MYPHRDRFDAGLLMVDLGAGANAPPDAISGAKPGESSRFSRIDASAAVDRVARVLPPVIDAVRHQGGSVVSFERSSVFAVFDGPDGAARGRAAAVRIEREFAGQPGAVRQRLHFGAVDALHLGDAMHSHYLLCGSAVSALAGMSTGTQLGTLLASEQACARMQADVVSLPARPLPEDMPLLDAYLPVGVRSMLDRADGAYRSVACLWLESRSWAMKPLHEFYCALRDLLIRYEGALIKSHPSPQGTRWLCGFGMSVAHEDDPERAALAALDMQALLTGTLEMRGGLHGGVVASIATGRVDRRAIEIIGDVVTIAGNAMDCADWGEIWMTDVQRCFTPSVQALPRGEYALGMHAEPVRLFSLFGQRPAARAVNVLAPLVGRDEEIAVLREALRAALAGRGTALGIEGDTGQGKSRLKHEVTLMAGPLGYAVHRGQAISVGGVAYGVVAQLLRGAMGLPEGAEREVVLERVRTECQRLELVADHEHYLTEVLGHRCHSSPLSSRQSKQVRQRSMQAIRAYLSEVCREQPRLFVIDDAHWADETSAEAIEHLATAVPEVRAVMLVLYRPGYRAARNMPSIKLAEIRSEEIARLASALIGGPISSAVEQLVGSHSQGNPLYVEEIARHLHESKLLTQRRGHYDLIRAPTPDEVPRSLEAIIASRLDRVSPAAQKLAQVGAVLGRRFPRVLLNHFDELRDTVDQAVLELRSAHILFDAVANDEPVYVFKHALTRDVVYSSILHRRRLRLHRAAAALVERLFASERDRYLPLLAYHYEQAGDEPRARSCYLSAAQEAVARYAHAEAERLCRSYLGLVDRPTGESVTVRNFLASEVLHPRGALKQAADEHEIALAEAKLIEDAAGQGLALRGLSTIYWETGFMQQAEDACEHALVLLRVAGDRRAEGTALMTLANIRGDQGHLSDALSLYGECLAVHREVGNDEGAALTLSNMAEVHRLQGRLDESRATYEQALTLIESVRDRPSTGVVLSNLAVVYHEMGHTDVARTVFRRALDIHRETGGRAFEAYTRCEMVRMERRLGANFDDLERMIKIALGVAAQAGTIDRSLCLCEHGHVALLNLDADKAHELLRSAAELTPVSKVGADSEFGAAIMRLRRAIQAAEVGVPLFRGERLDDLPDGLRRKLAARGELGHLPC